MNTMLITALLQDAEFNQVDIVVTIKRDNTPVSIGYTQANAEYSYFYVIISGKQSFFADSVSAVNHAFNAPTNALDKFVKPNGVTYKRIPSDKKLPKLTAKKNIPNIAPFGVITENLQQLGARTAKESTKKSKSA